MTTQGKRGEGKCRLSNLYLTLNLWLIRFDPSMTGGEKGPVINESCEGDRFAGGKGKCE